MVLSAQDIQEQEKLAHIIKYELYKKAKLIKTESRMVLGRDQEDEEIGKLWSECTNFQL